MKSYNSTTVVESLIPSREYAVEHFGLDSSLVNPAVYVGTYAKYAAGSIDGEWVDISKCSDYDEFIEVCKAIHQDEEDPELMFQDYMNFPASLYHESFMGEKIFERIIEYAGMDDDKQEAYEVFCENISEDVDEFNEKYIGRYDSEEELAEELFYDQVESALGSLACYFDFKSLGRELCRTDYTYLDGFLFHSY